VRHGDAAPRSYQTDQFEAEFCNLASGWEKGQVEKNVHAIGCGNPCQRGTAAGKLPKVTLVACMRKRADHAPCHGQNQETLEVVRLTALDGRQ